MPSENETNSSSLTIPLLINGKEETTSQTFDVINPSTGKVAWKSSAASKEDAFRAVEAAQAAFPAWSKTKPTLRRDILLKAGNILESHAEDWGGYMVTETGSHEGFAGGFNVPVAAALLKDVAGRIATNITGSVPVCGEENRSAIVYKEPYGVIFGMAPWNAPYILGARAVAYAIAAGNTTVLKASELSPRCFWAIGKAFQEAGLPAGVLNILAYKPEDAPAITTALIEHPVIKKINFTGSTAVGSIIASTCGKNLKPCLMELGGKNTSMVLQDADLEKAAAGCAMGAFLHSGQICMSTDTIILHTSIAKDFKTQLSKFLNTTFPTSQPAPILVSSAGVDKNKKLVSNALSSGASVLHGDPNATEDSDTRLRPIVLEGLKTNMDLYGTESFGPSVSIIEVSSEKEAIRIANDTEYGLSASVWTKDLARGLRVAKRIESGAVHINGMTVHDEPALPHGGVKKSGFGRFNADAGLEEFLRTKTVTWFEEDDDEE